MKPLQAVTQFTFWTLTMGVLFAALILAAIDHAWGIS